MKMTKIKQLIVYTCLGAIVVACNKNEVKKIDEVISPNTLKGDISKDMTIDGQWTLDGVVRINSGVTLTIKPGTVVTANTDKDSAIDILVVSQGGKLNALGTEASPIIFTSAIAESKAAKGQDTGNLDAWGGIVINGYAKINTGATGVGEYAPTGTYGGTNDDDNSGTLQYVYLKYPGYSYDEDHQLNGVSLYAVGSKTTLDHLAVYKSGDDSFEFFGGFAKLTNVLSYDAVDDSLDWTDGWRGTITNAVVITYKDGDKCIEADNQETNNSLTPISNPTLTKIYISQRDGATVTAMNLRRGTNATLKDVYIWSVGTVFKIDDQSTKDNLEKTKTLKFENLNIDKDIAKLAYLEPTGKKDFYDQIKTDLEGNTEIKRTEKVDATTTPSEISAFVEKMKASIGIKQ